MFLPHPCVKVSIVGSLRDREVASSASDRQGSNFESCVWRTVSSQSSHHPEEVLLAQFSLYVHKGGLKPDSFHYSRYIVVFNPFYYSIKSLLLGTKCVFSHQDLDMFGLKLNFQPHEVILSCIYELVIFFTNFASSQTL